MVWSEYIGQSITVPSDKNPASATDTRDWVFIGGNLPAEFVNTPYNAALIFYNGKYVGVGSETKFLALVPSGSNAGTSSIRIVAYITFDGAAGQFVTYANFLAADSSRSNAGGVSLENPRAIEAQETRPDSLVRFDSWQRSPTLDLTGATALFNNPPTVPGSYQPLFIANTVVATPNASGNVIVPLPHSFPNGLSGVVVSPGDTTSGLSQVVATNYSLSGFTAVCRTGSGAAVTTICRFNYLAWGW